MVHVEARINSTKVHDFVNFFKINRSTDYEFLIYWLKFQIRKLEPAFLMNFNIIPFGLDLNRPKWFKEINNLLPIFNNTWPKNERNYSKMTLKKIFEKLKEKYEKKSSFENNNTLFDWSNLFNRTLDSRLPAKVLSLNYKISLNGLST